MLERARRIEAEFEALDSDVASLRDVISGQVRVGLIGTTARWLVPPLLTAIGERYPEVSVVVLDATTSSLVLNLLSGAIDLAVLNLPIDEAELLVEPLFDEDRLLIVPKGHPLYDRDSVDLSELVHHELLLEARARRSATCSTPQPPSRASASARRPSSTACACWPRWCSAGTAPGSCRRPQRRSASAGDWRRVQVTGVPGRSVGLVRRRRGLLSAAQRVVADGIRSVVADDARRSRRDPSPAQCERPANSVLSVTGGGPSEPPEAVGCTRISHLENTTVADSITITDNRTGEQVEIPILDGGVDAKAWSKLLPGVWFHDPAFGATSGVASSITELDGEAGILRYRGYPIEQLAEKLELPRGRLPADPRRPAHAGPVRGLALRDHPPHVHPRERAQALHGGLPPRRPPHGHARVHRRRAVDLLPRGQGHRGPRRPDEADRPPDRQDADAGRRRLPPLRRACRSSTRTTASTSPPTSCR